MAKGNEVEWDTISGTLCFAQKVVVALALGLLLLIGGQFLFPYS
jgi:hypothetical protein